MVSLSRIHRVVRDIADPAVDDALAAALPTAGRQSTAAIAEALLARGASPGLLAVVWSYHRLPPELQSRVCARAATLNRALREAMGAGDDRAALNAIAIIRAGAATHLAYLLAHRLRHGGDEQKDAAAAALLDLSRRTALGEAERLPAEHVGFVAAAVEEAAAAYGAHRRGAVVLALAWLWPRPTPAALRTVGDEKHPAAGAMQASLRRSEQAVVRRGLLVALGVPALAEAAVDGLRQSAASGGLADALSCWHLLALAPQRRAAAKVRSSDGLWAAVPGEGSASGPWVRGLAAYAVAFTPEPAAQLARLAEVGLSGDPAARLAALRRIIALSPPGGERDAAVDDAVAAFCDDAEPAVARIALRHLVRIRYPGLTRVLTRLVNAGDASLRRAASGHLAPMAFGRLWSGWPRMRAEQRRAAGRALIKLDPAFHRALGERLSSVDRSTRLRALSIIAELRQGAFFGEALACLSRSDDAYVASAAVRALGSAEGEAAVAALEGALEHADARVRANAIESLAAVGRGAGLAARAERLATLADDEEGRPRANAIGALLEVSADGALRSLRRMLGDARAGHRRSALWLVETAGVCDVARDVAELSISDPDGAVRGRAERVINGLLGLMSQRAGGAGVASGG